MVIKLILPLIFNMKIRKTFQMNKIDLRQLKVGHVHFKNIAGTYTFILRI